MLLQLRRHLVGDSLNYPLYEAIRQKDGAALHRLLRKGANVNAGRPEGLFPCVGVTTGSPLHCAVYVRDTKAVEELIRFGADVNGKDKDEETPLHWAVGLDPAWVATDVKVEIIQALLDSGADIDCRNKRGRTPLASAEPEIAALLIERGAQNDVLTAASLGDLNEVRRLIEAGADISVRTSDEYTALHLAARQGNIEIMRLLIGAGADVNARTVNATECRGWYTPLHLAVDGGHVEAAELLLEHGADVNARDNADPCGWTALRMASHSRMANLLRQHGGVT